MFDVDPWAFLSIIHYPRRTSGYQHRRLPLQRALVLADPATDTEAINDVRLFHPDRPAVLIETFDLPEFNRFVRRGAVFLADDAGDAPGIGQTTIFVKIRQADHGFLFSG